MKKIMISAAIFAAMMVSCTTETTDMVNDMENEAVNTGIFEEEKTVQKSGDYDKFVRATVQLVEMHRQWDYFQAVLPPHLLEKIMADTYSVEEGVFAVFLWWKNDETRDVMIEWEIFDQFMVNMPVETMNFYGFYW